MSAQLSMYVITEMCGVKQSLERSKVEVDNKVAHEICNITDLVNAFLLKHCQHCIIEDYIDITPDRGEYISYCSICLCTIVSGKVSAAGIHESTLCTGET